MSEELNLNLELRTIQKKRVRQLRSAGILPASVYGKGFEPIAVQVGEKDFLPVHKRSHGNHVIKAQIDGRAMPVLIHEVQFEKTTGKILHIDFMNIEQEERVMVEVPLAIGGKAPVEANGKGRLSQETLSLQFKCPAAGIPDHIDIDVSGLTTKGQTVHARDLKLPEGVTLAHKTEEDAVLVTVKSVHAAAEIETPQA
ncbi:MAG: 50S ribosomal protein L25 [Deltaproteobacteria bacterium ADurb.Bin510]|nr:MAG: 50S ribosomal protein L25 [Deltaproteobacteria bacterium ADurb.Bin510]